MPLPRMIVRPLKAAKPAMTSSMDALSHCTVMRGACDCAASDRCTARYSSIERVRPTDGVVTRAAASGPPVTGGADARLATATGAAGVTVLLDHAANPDRS